MKRVFQLIFLLFVFSCHQQEELLPNDESGFQPVSSGEIVCHTYYTLSYSEENEQARWVYYVLTPELIQGGQSRTDDFRADPLVSTGSASLEDYQGSGYDRGHLCPAADMALNHTSMSESFYLSNMSPQLPGFNRGIWSTLEDQVRKWALSFEKMYVVTGPVFKGNKGAIGKNQITVPGSYYKVLFDGKDRMIGIVLPHGSSTQNLVQFVVTVDQIEKDTDIDFFPGLDDQLENKLEGSIDVKGWSFD